MEFTPEQLAAQAKRKERETKVSEKYQEYSDQWFAEYNLLHLQEIAEEGLHECYNDSVDEFLPDFFADFSWDTRSAHQIQLILDDERFPAIAAGFREKLGYDIIAPLQQATAAECGE